MEYDGCRYSITNEKLEAILNGLDIKPEDKVLSICGSGDQPLALLEIAKEITVIDIGQNQIDLFKRRKGIICSGEYSKFRDVYGGIAFYNLSSRNEYFSNERLDKIKENINKSKIEAVCGNIFKKSFKKPFTKIYLSNAILFNDLLRKDTRKKIKKISKELSSTGLVYISDGDQLLREVENKGYEINSFVYPLVTNETLTEKARELQKPRNEHEQPWFPIVLQKVFTR
jgi:hypothetical protein